MPSHMNTQTRRHARAHARSAPWQAVVPRRPTFQARLFRHFGTEEDCRGQFCVDISARQAGALHCSWPVAITGIARTRVEETCGIHSHTCDVSMHLYAPQLPTSSWYTLHTLPPQTRNAGPLNATNHKVTARPRATKAAAKRGGRPREFAVQQMGMLGGSVCAPRWAERPCRCCACGIILTTRPWHKSHHQD